MLGGHFFLALSAPHTKKSWQTLQLALTTSSTRELRKRGNRVSKRSEAEAGHSLKQKHLDLGIECIENGPFMGNCKAKWTS